MKIRTKMIIILLNAAVIPVLIIIFAYQTRLRSMLQQNHERYVSSISEDCAAQVNGHFSEIESLMFQVRTQNLMIDYLKNVNSTNYHDPLNQIRTSQVAERLEFIHSTYSDIDYIGIVPIEEGIRIFKGYSSNLNRQYTELEYVQKVVRSDKQVFCSVRNDEEKQKTFVVFAICIMDGYSDNILGYLCAVMDVDLYFQELAEKQDQREFLVFDADGNEVFRHQTSIDPAEAENLYSMESGTPEDRGLDQAKYTVAVKTIDLIGWRMVFLEDNGDIQKDLFDITLLMIELVVVFLIFSTCSVFFIHYKINVPIQNLTERMNTMEDYKGSLPSPEGRDEIGQLGTAFNHLVERVNDQMAAIKQAEKSKSEYELRALQAQINPHFLYNTLNSIKCLARLGRTEEISKMSESLIDLLRISASKERMVTIQQEIDYCKAYAELMSLRAGNRIVIESSLSDAVKEVLLPKLSLQPLVENSILHGGIDHRGEMTITIHAYRIIDHHVIIEVSDDGCGMSMEKIEELNNQESDNESDKRKFSGVGIGNIRERLRIEFGENSSVRLCKNKSGGTTVLLSFQAN